MRTMKSAFTAILILIVLLLAGCYMDVQENQAAISLDIQNREIIGDSGDGNYIVLKVYDEQVIENLISSETLSYMAGQYIYYNPADIPVPVNGYADFTGEPLPDNGSVTMPIIASSSQYRLLVEVWSVSSGILNQTPNAGLSDPFEVKAGENIEIDVVLLYNNFFAY